MNETKKDAVCCSERKRDSKERKRQGWRDKAERTIVHPTVLVGMTFCLFVRGWSFECRDQKYAPRDILKPSSSLAVLDFEFSGI